MISRNCEKAKPGITKVYNEIISTTSEQKKAAEPPALKQDIPAQLQNKVELLKLLERLQKGELFCPSCGNSMLQCSKCHKTLEGLLELKGPSAKSVKENLEENPV